jgi:hypothetical protein
MILNTVSGTISFSVYRPMTLRSYLIVVSSSFVSKFFSRHLLEKHLACSMILYFIIVLILACKFQLVFTFLLKLSSHIYQSFLFSVYEWIYLICPLNLPSLFFTSAKRIVLKCVFLDICINFVSSCVDKMIV